MLFGQEKQKQERVFFELGFGLVTKRAHTLLLPNSPSHTSNPIRSLCLLKLLAKLGLQPPFLAGHLTHKIGDLFPILWEDIHGYISLFPINP